MSALTRAKRYRLVSACRGREAYPEYPPHWIYISPHIDDNRGGAVEKYTDDHGRNWIVLSRPPGDFWDRLATKHISHFYFRSSSTFLERHMTYEVLLPAQSNGVLCNHLLQHYRKDELQEDLCFALWRPSTGATRTTALIDTVLLPEVGERTLHGNASFSPHYLGRAANAACKHGMGLAFLHSHPTPGWQGMSTTDILAERDVIAYPAMATQLPLVGLTVGIDGYWSARVWQRSNENMVHQWCPKVRVVGPHKYSLYFHDTLLPPPSRKERLRRTFDTWGSQAQDTIARLHVGIVGLGSVGCLVAECMARIGVSRLTLIES